MTRVEKLNRFITYLGETMLMMVEDDLFDLMQDEWVEKVKERNLVPKGPEAYYKEMNDLYIRACALAVVLRAREENGDG